MGADLVACYIPLIFPWGYHQQPGQILYEEKPKRNIRHREIYFVFPSDRGHAYVPPSLPQVLRGGGLQEPFLGMKLKLEGVYVTWPDYFFISLALPERVVAVRWGFPNERF